MLTIAAIGILSSGNAQEISIDSAPRNGAISFSGARIGTTVTVEWAASLTEAGKTNWHVLTNVVATGNAMVADIPAFFRIRGVPDTNVMNGLVAYYPFESRGRACWWHWFRPASGDPARDVTGNGHDGIVSGATWTANGKIGAAYAFDGVDDHIKTSITNGLDGSFSFSCWIKANAWKDTGDGDTFMVSDVPGYGNYWATLYGQWQSGHRVHFSLFAGNLAQNPNAISSSSVSTGDWHFVAGVRDVTAATIKVYLDGVLAGQAPDTTTNMPAYSSFYMGNQTDQPNRQFNGTIDDVRVYARALSEKEIAALFKRGGGVPDSP